MNFSNTDTCGFLFNIRMCLFLSVMESFTSVSVDLAGMCLCVLVCVTVCLVLDMASLCVFVSPYV